MTLHKFTCTECDGDAKPFYTSFEPAFDDSFCPCCGKDATVKYHGPVVLKEPKLYEPISRTA
ncbi:hypothetical protein [Paenibacillus oryzisoli]|uniref:Uncharacterized protein n=1 Tax=Paenibacillus oryzisoli TaxID=1850517 RepID=A0A198ADM1_9BACL|nr:hypothetical protein [Paenibacillus oryzisoli]OAS19282.1 hypothetical protein A8708_26595 [Paenibacillus oryzisoli]